MMSTRPSGPAIVLTMALLAGAFAAGASPQTSPTRATWHGLQTVVQTSRWCEATNEESFVWVEETDAFSASRWVSKHVEWDDKGSCSKTALLLNRKKDVNWSVGCINRGQVDLMDWHGASVQPQCQENAEIWGTIRPGVHTGPPSFSPVDRSQLRDGCTYNQRSVTANGDFRAVTTQSITLEEASVSAKVFPSSAVEPIPGATVLHVEGRANVPVRWKFVLVESSRLRGYATNADITLAFFEIYDLPSLRGRYGTMDPDLIFDPSKFEPPWDQSRQWKRPYPDSGPHKWSVLESNDESKSANVNVTAMDFGAHGELKVYVSSKCGGGWLEVVVDETTGAAGVAIPSDDADGNFIPDSFKEYAGRAALEDNDADPVGDGTAGDGFTAFEEYRGFSTQLGGTCNSLLSVTHVRTNPAVKDLFVHASDPVLWKAVAGTDAFTSASGVALHMICPAQYVDDATRIVNFTMQLNPGEGIGGAKLTQDFPQHGLHLVNEPLVGLAGLTIPRPDTRTFGPPRNIDRVAVDVAAIVASAGSSSYPPAFIRRTAIHELGHAIGVRHHGDNNLTGPVVLLNLPACPPGMAEGTVAGDRACVATGIACRGGQNSGDQWCPMKYVSWTWYVPPGGSLTPVGPVAFRPAGSFSWLRRERLPGFVSRVDDVHAYRKDLDDAATLASAWKFCTRPTGTGINARPGDENHAGDAGQSCAGQIRVNDKP